MNTIETLSEKAKVKALVATLLQDSACGHDVVLGIWQRQMDRVWNSGGPSDVLAELGTEAARLLDLHTRTVAWLEANAPGCTDSMTSKVQAYTVHEDGTATINES